MPDDQSTPPTRPLQFVSTKLLLEEITARHTEVVLYTRNRIANTDKARFHYYFRGDSAYCLGMTELLKNEIIKDHERKVKKVEDLTDE